MIFIYRDIYRYTVDKSLLQSKMAATSVIKNERNLKRPMLLTFSKFSRTMKQPSKTWMIMKTKIIDASA
jgi:hypothetical protein